jgi:tetratricopeptide (TPR) repeat protein
LAGLLVYLFISPDPANQSQIGKAFLSFAATVVAISRVLHGNTTVSDQEYLAAYGDILNDVFSGNKKALRKLLKGIRLYNQNRFAGALRTLTSLKENCVSDHEHAVVLFFIAMCYDDRGFYDAAAASYREAIQHNPVFDVTSSNLGRIQTEKGEYETAIRSLQKAIQINKANQYAYTNLAGLHLSLLQYDKAIEFARTAVNIMPNMTEALETITLSYAGKQDRQTAESYFQKSILNGSPPEQLRSMIESLYQGNTSVLSPNK